MTSLHKTEPQYWLLHSRWFFVGGSIIAAIVALLAEGPGDYIGLALLCACVASISAWSLLSKPSLYWTVFIIFIALFVLGWTVEEPEPALFQSVLITAAVGWRIDRLAISLTMLAILILLPWLGSLGPNYANWGWWNWSVGTAFTWCLGRVIRLLEQTLTELTDARSKLIDSASKEERLRISRDVHDLVGHSLTAMLLNIRAAQRALDKDALLAKQALNDAERIGTHGIAEIRTTLVDIRGNHNAAVAPAEPLASLPNGEAILRLLQQQSHIDIVYSGDIASLQGPLAVTVYRLLQECITNCSKYAASGSAAINLDINRDEIILHSHNELKTGSNVPTSLSEKTLGLIGMRERVNSLGGSFTAGIHEDQWQIECRVPRHD